MTRTWRVLVTVSLVTTMLLVTVEVDRASMDGIDGWLLRTLYQDDTVYARSYSDREFMNVRAGLTQADVLTMLGRPLEESWIYEQEGTQHLVVRIDSRGRVSSIAGPGVSSVHGIHAGVSSEAARSTLGEPTVAAWAFTQTPNDSSYRVRVVVFRHGIVERTIHEYYLD